MARSFDLQELVTCQFCLAYYRVNLETSSTLCSLWAFLFFQEMPNKSRCLCELTRGDLS
jgi:hypothetical protein